MSETATAQPAALPSRRFEGRTEFRDLVRDALDCAGREGWPEIILSDADFADWPLGERAVADALNTWARGGRKMVLLARDYEHAVRNHARFVQWRGTWSHIVTAWGCRAADRLELPSGIWSHGWVLERLDPDRCNGYCGAEPARRLLMRERLNHWIARSSSAFPATRLGL